MKLVCHFVPALLCVLAFPVSGCFLMHQAEGGDPGTRCRRPSDLICCDGRTPLAVHETVCPFRCPAGSELVTVLECTGRPPPPPPRDSGRPPPPPPPPDGGPLMCEQVRADATCLESFAVEPRRRFELPVMFDTCACCAETECRAEPDFATQTLRLTTTLCPDPCDCDACNTPRASCAVPGLPEGSWAVEVNGTYAFDLPVVEDSGLVPPPGGCATYADPDACHFGDEVRLFPSLPSQLCVGPGRFASDQLAQLSLAFECPGCGELGGTCAVSYEERVTRDLPPGGELHVVSTAHLTDCDVHCPPECSLRTQTCILPPLMEMGFYRVWYEGSVVLSFTAGPDDTVTCATVEGPIVPG